MGNLNGHLMALAAAGVLVGTLAGAADAQTPKRGGTVVTVLSVDPTGTNPVITTGNNEVHVGCEIYEGLTIWNTVTDKPEPGLAESWTISPDGKTYTFKLRKAEWHDGKLLTSEDVRYTYMEVAAKIGPTWSPQLGKLLESIETPDPQTAVVKLTQPYGPLLRQTTCANAGAILPSHLYKGTDPKNNPVTQKAVGTGPFKFSEWVRGDRIVVVRNDKYWDQPKPYLDRIVNKVIANFQTRTQALLAGEIDFIHFGFFSRSDGKTVEASNTAKMEIGGYPANAHVGFFNLKRKPFDDVRVRQALLMAIDRKYLFDNVYFGYGKKADAPWPTQIEWASDPNVSYDKTYPFDPEKAGRMLEEAGYKADANGVRFKATIIYDAAIADRQQVALALQAWWKRAGVEVTPTPVDFALLMPRAHQEGNFDVYLTSYASYGDPAVGISRIFTTSTIGNNFGNASWYSNPQVDELFVKAVSLTSLDERGAIYRQIQPIVMRDMPSFLYMASIGYDAANKKLKGAWGYAGIGFWQNAWLDQ